MVREVEHIELSGGVDVRRIPFNDDIVPGSLVRCFAGPTYGNLYLGTNFLTGPAARVELSAHEPHWIPRSVYLYGCILARVPTKLVLDRPFLDSECIIAALLPRYVAKHGNVTYKEASMTVVAKQAIIIDVDTHVSVERAC